MLDSLLEVLTHPLVILLIGLVTVVGMIIVLRVNAFIALITAAMLVSLLSPGPLAEKMARVATAFGSVAGSIGIVIAMAAVIGKCLMDSGAADRIVRCFLRVLGEKRAPEALMGASFVLAVPVFFDTVFYLMVPLARSLWRRTRRNYVLYILAIATGGVITHGMVPPTPGPLLMAANLNIDIGVMIMVGAVLGLPTALVGLLGAGLINRLMDIPCRPYSGEPEPEPPPDDQLPGLWLSVLPVLLPVVLISARTVTEAVANAEHAALIRSGEVSDWPGLCRRLGAEDQGSADPMLRRARDLLDKPTRNALAEAAAAGRYGDEFKARIRAALNRLLEDRRFCRAEELVGMKLPPEARKLMGRDLARLPKAEVERLNRLLLETALADQLDEHVWETPRRKLANVFALAGDANLALLVSAAIAMGVLVRQRSLTLAQLAKTAEGALMSGGVIILITAGGGAFGKMLAEAGVGDAVEQMFAEGGQSTGLIMLLIGFGVSSVLKIAQGSSTVAMITASAMMAAMGATAETLAFHPVYLATAIAGGSVVGTWMNDSGFWIFARMSALTEVEALKSWTILLAVLGVTILGVSILAAQALPLTQLAG